MAIGQAAVNAARKTLIQKTDGQGNPGIKKQQGTTRVVYDSLPFDGRTNFQFFFENDRAFPFTNLASGQGQMSVGEAIAVQRVYLTVFEIDPATGEITDIASLPATGNFSVMLGDINMVIANVQVIKPIPVVSWQSNFNKNAYWEDYNNFEMDTNLVVQPLIEFEMNLRVPFGVTIDDTFIRLTIEGIGAILSPEKPQ